MPKLDSGVSSSAWAVSLRISEMLSVVEEVHVVGGDAGSGA
jgi:hypothetical protein